MAVPSLVIVVRHAQSEHHVQRLTGGWTDTPLTAEGHEQSRLVAARLRAELGEAPVRVYTSDLQRAAQTAAHIGEAFGTGATADERLREHNNGACANLTIDEAARRYPETWAVAVPLDTRPFPGAETPREFYARAGAFVDDLRADGSIPIVVSHGGTIICLVARWLMLDAEALEPIGFRAYTTGITVLQADAQGGRVLERLNDVAHLDASEHGWASIGSLLRG